MRRRKRDGQFWVATRTGELLEDGVLYEQGRIYDYHGSSRDGHRFRPLSDDERTIACPQCGERFADEDGPAEQHLEMHIEGDVDSPSICDGRSDKSSPATTISEVKAKFKVATKEELLEAVLTAPPGAVLLVDDVDRGIVDWIRGRVPHDQLVTWTRGADGELEAEYGCKTSDVAGLCLRAKLVEAVSLDSRPS